MSKQDDFVMPLHFQRFLTSTQDWSDEEVGCYLRLLMHQWHKKSIPSDKSKQKRIADSVEKNYWIIEKKFAEMGDGLQNKTMEEIRKEMNDYRKVKSDAGKEGGNPNFEKGKPNPYYQKDKQEHKQEHNQSDKQEDKQQDNHDHNQKDKPITITNTITNPLTITIPKEEKKATKNSSRGFVLMKERFLKIVSDRQMEYFFSPKDAGGLKKIESKMIHLCKAKNEGKTVTDEKLADAFEYLLTHIKSKFVLENFSISIIDSKWNEIVNEVKNGKNGSSRDDKLSHEIAAGNRKIDELYASKQD